MSQPNELVDALKRALRRQGLSYAKVAQRLGVSESTIKRAFARGNFTLQRMADICAVANTDIGHLAALAEEKRRDLEQLTEEQERDLVSDPKLLLMAFLLLNDWKVEDILESYTIEELESIRLLARLDRAGIIDLMPGNRVRMRLSRRFGWRRRGPIQRVFEKRVQTEFFASRFDQPGELRLVFHGMLSEQSIYGLHQRLEVLFEEFETRAREDRNLPAAQRLGTSAVLALRPWHLSLFDELRRA